MKSTKFVENNNKWQQYNIPISHSAKQVSVAFVVCRKAILLYTLLGFIARSQTRLLFIH